MQPQAQARFGADEIKSLASLVVTVAIMGALLFGAAGTLDWMRGWLFLGLFVAACIVAILWVWRTNPELFAARRKFQPGTKAWDAVVASLSIACFIAILPVAGLDERFQWAPQPDWVVALGYALFFLGFWGTSWAQSVNRHFEPTVRIQTDRDHKVVSTGPYAFIRHPGYAFGLIFGAGIPLALGSLYALIPVGVLLILLFGRTLGEEAELRKGLPGYAEYAARVRWRWLPGVW